MCDLIRAKAKSRPCPSPASPTKLTGPGVSSGAKRKREGAQNLADMSYEDYLATFDAVRGMTKGLGSLARDLEDMPKDLKRKALEALGGKQGFLQGESSALRTPHSINRCARLTPSAAPTLPVCDIALAMNKRRCDPKELLEALDT